MTRDVFFCFDNQLFNDIKETTCFLQFKSFYILSQSIINSTSGIRVQSERNQFELTRTKRNHPITSIE